ncbi:hypothetical protein B0H11DRAFT_1668689, partial [Mycena galericulata]
TPPILTPEVDAFIDDIKLAEWNSPGGIEVAVVCECGQGGWKIENKGCGAAKATKFTLDTVFSIGSN